MWQPGSPDTCACSDRPVPHLWGAVGQHPPSGVQAGATGQPPPPQATGCACWQGQGRGPGPAQEEGGVGGTGARLGRAREPVPVKQEPRSKLAS